MSQAIQEAVRRGGSLTNLCQMAGTSRACYYRGLRVREPVSGDATLRGHVQRVALDWTCYGYRRVTKELHRQGVQANHKRVLRLMREEGLVRRPPKRFVATTDSDRQRPSAARVPEPGRRDGGDRARPTLGVRPDLCPPGARVHLPRRGAGRLLAPLSGLVAGPTP